MRAIMVMYDSLRLDHLPCYGGNEIELPNFKRLAERAVTFDNSYVCSLPCMPARRELHTGRPNFLHRSWGPLEPFDDSMPELLKNHGIYTRLVTDHNHYVEDGGATYHPRYSTWECNRGQEGDPWVGCASPEHRASPHVAGDSSQMQAIVQSAHSRLFRQDLANRTRQVHTADYPQARTFAQGVEFIENNSRYDNWFLQIETFDPHEPFNAPGEYIAKVFDPDVVSELDWPPYTPVNETPEAVAEIRKKYLALLCFCDDCLGQVLDQFDKHGLWDDTMLIVNTDHGFLQGEHNWWAKGRMPDYQEIAHTPLFIWEPRAGKAGERRSSLMQTIDLAPTLLDFFGLEVPADMLGKPLAPVIEADEAVREYGIFGSRGGVLSITDGQYVFMMAPKQTDVQQYDYTLMPTHMRSRFSVEELRQAEFAEPFSFTKGCCVLKIPTAFKPMAKDLPVGAEKLFDVQQDPRQQQVMDNPRVTARMKAALVEILRENDAPAELYAGYGLQPNHITN